MENARQGMENARQGMEHAHQGMEHAHQGMVARTLWALALVVLVGASLIGLFSVTPVAAQSLVDAGATRTTGEAALQQVDLAIKATDLAAAKAALGGAISSLEEQQSVLQNALTAATTDAERSRAQGLLNHVNAALASAQTGLQASDLSAAQSAANAARGEINEALNEIPAQPSVAQQAPTTLPKTGGFPIEVLWVAGLATLMTGAAMRRLFHQGA